MKRLLAATSKRRLAPGTQRDRRHLGPYGLGMLLCVAAAAYAQPVAEAWVRRYSFENAGSHDQPTKVVADAEGNAIVVGYTGEGISGRDMLIIKYSMAGVALWTNRYDGMANGDDDAYDVAVDSLGNVFVTGTSTNSGSHYDYLTIAYSPSGVALWTNRYNGPGNGPDYAYAVGVDNNGHVFVAGTSTGSPTGYGYATIAYSVAGVALWTNRYHGGSGGGANFAHAIAVDASGSVFVTGESANDYATVAYSAAGVALWTNRYNGPYSGGGDDEANAIVVDNNGNVVVTGSSRGSVTSFDYATIAYSSTGVPLWTNRYNGPGNSEDRAFAVAVDSSGNVFVAGVSWGSGSLSDYTTIAYSASGVPLWTNRYNGPGNGVDQAFAVAVDSSGKVLVTGESTGVGTGLDYATIAYSVAGVALWTNRYDGPAHRNDRANAVAVGSSEMLFVTGYSSNPDYVTIAYSWEGRALWTNSYNGPGNRRDEAYAIAVDNGGNVFVTGRSVGSGGDSDYATIAYSANGVARWTNRYNGPANGDDLARAVGVDGSGRVFVTGHSKNYSGDSDYLTVAYSAAGVPLWTNSYNGPDNRDDEAHALAIDGNGRVFVTGYSKGPGDWDWDYATIAYSAAGLALWTNRYGGLANDYDRPYAIAVESSGNVVVTGRSYGAGRVSEYATIAYSAEGVPLWTNRHGAGAAYALTVDSNGRIFVTGNSVTIAYSSDGMGLWTNRHSNIGLAVAVGGNGNVLITGNSLTIAYSSAGVAIWTNGYNGVASAVAVDHVGNVFVAGSSYRIASGSDYEVIAYSAAGAPLWTNRYNGPANGNDRLQPSCLAVGPDGAVYVTGASDGDYSGSWTPDYATVKYVMLPRLAIQPVSADLLGVSLTLSGIPQSSWSIERAPSLLDDWTRLGELLIGTNGFGIFHDIHPPPNGAVYRAAQP